MARKTQSGKIAVVSDVHGNLPALEAVLEDAAHHGAERVWNLGDMLGYAPFPNEVIGKLREANSVSIIGNYDLKVLAFKQKQSRWKQRKMPEKYAAFAWNDEHLSRSTRAYLELLPQQRLLEVSGRSVLLVHGSPAAIDDFLGVDTPEARLAELADMADVDLIACGHSHEAFVRHVRDVWFVNPGSVGRPEGGDWRASYALLEWSRGDLHAGHRRVGYDIDRVARAVHAAGLPEDFIKVFREARSLDQLGHDMGSKSTLDAVLTLAQACQYEQEHTHHVTKLALALFDELKELHGLGVQERFWLQCAALLHDIGWVDGQQGHHKTALRRIIAEPRLPFDRRQRWIVGLIARYHRKALPGSGHKYFGSLSADDRRRVCILGGILRLADGLDRSHRSVIRKVRCRVSDHAITVACEAGDPADEEIVAARKKADLLERVFDRHCRIVATVKAR